MVSYEYRMIPQREARRNAGVADEMAREMNLRAMLGWEYVGSEMVTEKRRWLGALLGPKSRQFLVYRRAASTRVAVPAEHARAARETVEIVRTDARIARRSDLVADIRAGKRRIRPQPAQGTGDRDGSADMISALMAE